MVCLPGSSADLHQSRHLALTPLDSVPDGMLADFVPTFDAPAYGAGTHWMLGHYKRGRPSGPCRNPHRQNKGIGPPVACGVAKWLWLASHRLVTRRDTGEIAT